MFITDQDQGTAQNRKTIAEARVKGVFLVPNGPTKSGNNFAFDESSRTGTMLVKLHSRSIA
ncbi:hypothetical protein DPMN_136692 [Dreissena polymorpha]|uniref:Uncharacterized protein n=1 Tax=Dreissena polymorpha TaxID=45954 RepID=A0A9D4JFS4_DREPO|nr:hypothetical protein DPMN_136692 [Dreissena polymorpha]